MLASHGSPNSASVKNNPTMQADYVEAWNTILRGCTDWDAKQIAVWVKSMISTHRMDNPASEIYHDPPEYWVAAALVPRWAKRTGSGIDVVLLRQKIYEVFEDHIVSQSDDWAGVKQQIEAVITPLQTTGCVPLSQSANWGSVSV